MRVKKMKLPKYRILTIDAKELYELDLAGASFNIYNKDGNVERRRFNSFLYNSLEVMALKNEYEKAKTQRKITGKFEFCKYNDDDSNDDSGVTLSVINITFDKDLLEFNRKKSHTGYVYLRAGHRIDFATDLVDNVCIKEGKLIAVVVPYTSKDKYKIGEDTYEYKKVECPCEESILEGLFEYNPELQCYLRTKKRVPVKIKKNVLREHLYENGFTLEGKKQTNYIRYKRSAGSSRQGNCLFIAEPLYKNMMKWSSCGLDLDKVDDQISKESYISLTLSNMEKEICVPADAIVILPDAKSIFNDTVVSVEVDKSKKNSITACEKLVEVENKIWDGQALLDESVFEENGYADKGMMLLRNRFFKTCAFNTKLQKWFKERGIKNVSDLNKHAVTRAKSIEDIKLVVTDSSIKYIKLYNGSREDAINAWLDTLTLSFGLVKTEKETKHMYGKMVQTSYQLLNTLELSDDEVKSLLRDSFSYLWKIQSDPMYMRYFIKMQLREDKFDSESLFDECEDVVCDDGNHDNGSESDATMRKNVIMELLQYNDRFAFTDAYSEFRTQTKKSIIRNFRKGHLLVDGTYATLFGNGYEMLHALTDRDYDLKKPERLGLDKGQIRVTRFENGKELLCARSPHITMGNLYVCENVANENDVYSKYFNLTNEIVCINSIEENILQRLNGCDFDSDAMLITDNEIMLKSAKKNYNRFLVPYCGAEPTTKEGVPLYQMDNDISNNKIGEIVNLSQWLNSIYWDKLSKGEDDKALYLEICKLAVLSGMEIDRAKRDYGVETAAILKSIRKNNTKDEDGNTLKKPQFFEYAKKSKSTSKKDNETIKPAESAEELKKEKEEEKEDSKYNKNIQTSMQKLVNVINEEPDKSPRRKKDQIITLSELLPDIEFEIKDNDYRYRKKIIEKLNKSQTKLSAIRSMMHLTSDREKTAKMLECREVERECVAYVKSQMKSIGVLYLLINALDDEKSDAQSCRSLLLSAICSASDDFYRLIANTRDTMYQLEPDDNGDIKIYGYNHSMREIK